MKEIKEEWRNIKGYEGIYQVSNLSKAKSLDRIIKYINNKKVHTKGKYINDYDNSNGYWYVDLYGYNKKRKKKGVHILVTQAFINNPNNFLQINHKDENRSNNIVNNLEWCTAKYNNNYGNHTKKLRLAHLGKNKGNKKNFKYIGKLKNGTKLTWIYYKDYIKKINKIKEEIV